MKGIAGINPGREISLLKVLWEGRGELNTSALVQLESYTSKMVGRQTGSEDRARYERTV